MAVVEKVFAWIFLLGALLYLVQAVRGLISAVRQLGPGLRERGPGAWKLVAWLLFWVVMSLANIVISGCILILCLAAVLPS